MTEEMKSLLTERDAIRTLEEQIKEKKLKIARLALEIEAAVGEVGNIQHDGQFYQIRKRKNGSVYVCGPRDTAFGSWRKK